MSVRRGIQLDAEASREVIGAVRYYHQQRTGMGQAFFAALQATLASACSSPRRHRVVAEDTAGKVRCAVLPGFSCRLFFTVQDGKVLVLGLAHLKPPAQFSE